MTLRRRSWFYIAPVFWLGVYLAFATLLVRFTNGHWPAAVLERLPSLARADPAQCESERDDPVAPANNSRFLGIVEKDTVDEAIVFVHGYHDGAHKWRKLAAAFDDDFRLQGDKVLAFFPCFPTHDMRPALEMGTAAIERAVAQVPPGVQVHLVGFSMGGLVIKHYLRKHLTELDPNLVDIVTLNTPHHGVPSFFLGYITGDRSLIQIRMMSTLDPLAALYGDNWMLRELDDPELVRRFKFHTLSGAFIASPVNAFLGAAWLSESDGLVPGRSGHLRVPRWLDPDPGTFLDGLPYSCTVYRPAPGLRGMDRQITYFRPLSEGDLFHSNVPLDTTTSKFMIELFREELGRINEGTCGTGLEPLDMEDHRSWALLMLAVPLVALVAGGAGLGRVLGRPRDGMAIVLYGTTVSFIAFTLSAGVPQGLFRSLHSGELTGVSLAVMTAVIENLWFIPWFAYYLRHLRRRGGLTPGDVYASGLAFGLMIAMVEQLLFVWTTTGALRDITVMRLVLAAVPRLCLGWVMAWVLVERARLAAAATGSAGARPRRIVWARRLILLLPIVLHAIYSSLMFHAISTLDALLLFTLFAVAAGILILAARAERGRSRS